MVLNSHSTDAENLVYFESLKRCVYLSFLKKVTKFVEFQSFDKSSLCSVLCAHNSAFR